MKKFTIKAILHFSDGVNKGQTDIVASNEDEAKKIFIKKMIDIWKVKESDIDIISINKK